jgi:hypothetical protein
MKLNLDNESLTIEFEWYEQLWAFTLDKQLRIPLSHIDRVTTAEPQSNWAEIRAPGTFLPGVIKAGTYYTKRGKEFWYVTAEKDYLTLELHDEPYRRLIITTPNHISWCEQIDRVLLGDRG